MVKLTLPPINLGSNQQSNAQMNPGQLPAPTAAVASAAGNLYNAVTIPLRQAFQMPVTDQDLNSAEQGSEAIFGGLSGNAEANIAADTALPAIKYAGAKGVQAATDALDAAKAQPGGLQAGFIKTGEDTTEYPFAKTPSSISKLGKGQNQAVRQIRFKGSPNAPALEDNANNTLDRLGVQGNANDQLAMFPKIKTMISDWIKSKSSMAGDAKFISTDDVKAAIKSEAKKQFGTDVSDNVISQHINDVYAKAQQENNDIATQKSSGEIVNNPYFDNPPDMSPSTTKGGTVNQTKFVRAGGAKPGTLAPGQAPGYLKEVALPKINGKTPDYATPGGYQYGLTGPSETVSGIVPEKVSSKSIYNLKVASNNSPLVDSAFEKIFNGQRSLLTDDEKVALSARNAYDNLIAKLHPDVKQATKDLSVLNNKHVYESLESARFSPPPQMDVAENIIPKNLRETIPFAPLVNKGINKAANNPNALKIAGAIAGIGGIAGGSYLLGKNGNLIGKPSESSANGPQQKQPTSVIQNIPDNIHTIQDIPQNDKEIKLDQQGNYPVGDPGAITDASGQTMAINYDTYKSQRAGLEQKLGQAQAQDKLTGLDTAGPIQTQLNTLDSQYNSSANQNMLGAYTDMKTVDEKMKDARAILTDPTTPTTLLKDFPTYDALQKAFNGKYATLAQDLQDIEATSPQFKGTLFAPQTTSNAITTLDNAKSKLLNVYYNVLRQYSGGSVITNPTDTTTPPGQNQVPSQVINPPQPYAAPQNALQGFNKGATLNGVNAPLPAIQ